jgi:hypothetical protein
VRIPEIDRVHPQLLETLLNGNGDVGGVTTESEARWQWDSAKLRRKENILALFGVKREPFPNDGLGITLK